MSNTSKKHGLTITIENASHDIYWYADDNGNVFFNATAIWKAAGSPANRRPYAYLRTEEGQSHIVEQYRILTTNKLNQPVTFDPDTWVHQNMKPLPDEVLSHFVETTRGYNGGTFLSELVAMDYAQWVSVEVKDEILRTYRAFGSVNRAIEEGRTEDAVVELGKVADKVIVKEMEEAGQEATAEKVKARKDGIEVRHILTELIQDMYGKDHPQLRRYLSRVSDAANFACFGVIAEDIQQGLQSSKTRPCFSPAALRAIEYAETSVITGIRHGRLRNIDDMVAELNRLSPLLKMMANTMGDYPLIMENTNVRGGSVNAKGTFQGIMPAGASKVGFAAKQLTSEQG